MRKAISLFTLSICLLFIAGCQESAKKAKPVGTTTESDSNFPQVMVGVWEADVNDSAGAQWGIKFETDGTILKIIHMTAGPINVSEGGVQREGKDPNSYMVFTILPPMVNYDPKTTELEVRIKTDYFRMAFSDAGFLEGEMEDVFAGSVPQNGSTWNVKWYNYCWLEGAASPDINEINANPEKLVFRKVDLNEELEKHKQHKHQ